MMSSFRKESQMVATWLRHGGAGGMPRFLQKLAPITLSTILSFKR